MPMRFLLAVVLGGWVLGASAQDKTLTFDNATPAKTIHLLNGTSVTISTTGNLVAKCTLNGSSCADVGSGGGGTNPPTVSLTASGFSASPDGSNAYPANTSFTLTPLVTNADVCVMTYSGGTATNAINWGGPTTSFGARSSVSVPSPSSTYVFSFVCYNATGSASGNATVTTSADASVPPGPDCSAVSSMLNNAGFSRSGPQTWLQLQGMPNFPDYDLSSGSITVPKYRDGGVVFLGAAKNTYTAVQFTTPIAGWSGFRFTFQPSQITGTVAGSGYVTVSQCQGDLRYNDQSAQPFPQACSSITTGGTSTSQFQYIQSSTTSSSATQCVLDFGKTYYLNYANVDPRDGLQVNEHTCSTGATPCGMQFKQQ